MAVAITVLSRYIPPRKVAGPRLAGEAEMRAETQSIVEDIKRSVGLLRRHL